MRMHPDFRDCLGLPLTSEYLLKIYIHSNELITFLLWMLHPLACSTFSSSLHGLLLCIIRHHPARLLQLTQMVINSNQYNHLLPAIQKISLHLVTISSQLFPLSKRKLSSDEYTGTIYYLQQVFSDKSHKVFSVYAPGTC